MNESFKKLLIVLFVSLTFLGLTIYHVFYDTGYHKDDIETLRHFDSSQENILYRYENHDGEIIIHSDIAGYTYLYVLDKNHFGKYAYQESTSGLIFGDEEWYKVNDSLYFTIVDHDGHIRYVKDTSEVDTSIYKPEGTKLYYKTASNEIKSRWIYVVDKSENAQNFSSAIELNIFDTNNNHSYKLLLNGASIDIYKLLENKQYTLENRVILDSNNYYTLLDMICAIENSQQNESSDNYAFLDATMTVNCETYNFRFGQTDLVNQQAVAEKILELSQIDFELARQGTQ